MCCATRPGSACRTPSGAVSTTPPTGRNEAAATAITTTFTSPRPAAGTPPATRTTTAEADSSRAESHSTVDTDGLGGDEAAVVGEQQCTECGDVVRIAEPRLDHLTGTRLLDDAVGHPLVVELVVPDQAGGNGIGTDSLRAVLTGDMAHQRQFRRFAHRVGDAASCAVVGVDRRGEHDRSAAGFDHRGDRMFGADHETSCVDAHHLVERLQR